MQSCVQALADARSAEQMQVEWLKEQMAPHFTQKLLRCTRDILKWIGAHDSDSKHQFPILAGSHLHEVRLASPDTPHTEAKLSFQKH